MIDTNFIIPAIDLIQGKCVRLEKGDFSKKTIYAEDPLQVARSFEKKGITRLHLVDLDGAKNGKIQNLKILQSIAESTNLSIDFGGGVATIEDVKNILDSGASMVTVGTVAVKQPELLEEWIMEFGAEKFLVGADVLHERIKISGWQKDGGITVFDMIRNILALGVTQIFCTDISKDGMLEGPAIPLYIKILEEFPSLRLIASGGIIGWHDIDELKRIGCSSAIVGKALYEGKILL